MSATPWGIDAKAILVEVDLRLGLPQVQIVGLADAAVRESRERVRSAIKNSGFDLPPRAVVINLSPADLRKEGNQLDLAIALALLAAYESIPHQAIDDCLACGELALDGSLRPIRGALSIADLGRQLEVGKVLLPVTNLAEAAALGSLAAVGIDSLEAAVHFLLGKSARPRHPTAVHESPACPLAIDLADVRGQETAKRGLEVAAAGGHNLLMIGPPGGGKTMLARRLATILPPLEYEESIEVTKIHSLASDTPPRGLLTQRPIRSPHPSVSTAAMIGGGHNPRPGEASLAHAGILFLDELPEFRRDTLEALRQPVEEGCVVITRVRRRVLFPARFTLVAAMNPCPCGHLGDRRHECACEPPAIHRYRRRISGPLLDRIDLHIEVGAVELDQLRAPPGESSIEVARRVLAARRTQTRRFGRASMTNAKIDPSQMSEHCRLTPAADGLLTRAFQSLGLSARALHRIVKVARTISDLEGVDQIAPAHIAEAIQFRALDRRLSH